jgi:hypothetical protein
MCSRVDIFSRRFRIYKKYAPLRSIYVHNGSFVILKAVLRSSFASSRNMFEVSKFAGGGNRLNSNHEAIVLLATNWSSSAAICVSTMP